MKNGSTFVHTGVKDVIGPNNISLQRTAHPFSDPMMYKSNAVTPPHVMLCEFNVGPERESKNMEGRTSAAFLVLRHVQSRAGLKTFKRSTSKGLCQNKNTAVLFRQR